MKKILSFFAAMLVAGAVFATPVVLPATLDVSNVSFRSEGMPDFVLEEGDYAGTYFDMGAHDSSNDTLLYAEWDVTIEPIKYNIAVDVYNTNSWRVQLYLLNQAGDTLKSLRYKGSSGQCGQFAIGAMDLSDLAAGDYKVRARAATAWSAMKLKDVIFEADYQGVNVNLPGTLLPAYAELSSGASVANHAIAFNPGTAPEEYAKWNVTFANAGEFNVSIDYTATNGHTYGVALLSADGQTEIKAVAEAQAWDTGVKDLGAITVPAAGKYIVKLTNATQWSEAVLNSITFAAPYEPAMKTIYCKMDKAWWTADNAAVGIYAWGDNSEQLAAWPGVRMTPVEGETGVWSIELDINTYKNCIFTRVNGEGDVSDWGAKTVDLTIPTDDNDMFTITNDAAVWGDPGCDGVWSKFEASAPVEKKVIYDWAGKVGTTILGASSVEISTVKIHTNSDEVPAIKFGSSYVYADGKWLAIKPAEGGFKAGDVLSVAAVFNNANDTKYAQIDLRAANGDTRIWLSDSASTINGRTNAGAPIVQTYTLEADQDSLFFGRYGNTTMFITMLKVERAGGAPEPAHTYTVAGSSAVAFGTAWDPTNTANDMAKQDDGSYKWEKANLELPAGTIEFKVCQDHDWATCWPAQNYALNVSEAATYTLTITFNPANKNVGAELTKTGSAEIDPAASAKGSWDGWAAEVVFVLADNKETASGALNLEPGDYEFKVILNGGDWRSNGYSYHREFTGAENITGNGDNMVLKADVAGEYTLTWTFATNALNITFPVASSIDNTNVAVKAQKMIINGQLFIIRNGEKFNVQGQVIR